MTDTPRDTLGKFAPKSETPRRIRSVNLTDDAWQWLAVVAEKAGMSRNDYLEALAFGSIPLMETVESQTQPLMETVESQIQPLMETVESQTQPLMETVESQIQPLMETVDAQREVDDVNIEKQPYTELYPFIETVLTEVESVKLELEAVRAENQLLQLGNSEIQVETLNQELASVRSQLETVQAENENLKASQPAAEFEPLEASDLLNRLKAKRKKATASLADIEALLEMMGK